MAFKKGDKKIPGSGRKAGTPHKKSLLVKEILENHGINLIEQIIVRLSALSKKDQVDALLKLVPYCHPRLNVIEGTFESKGEILIRSNFYISEWGTPMVTSSHDGRDETDTKS